jgi:hypothetical protein
MLPLIKRLVPCLALALALAGCNSEFSLNCTTPKGNHLLMVKPGVPWLPPLGPSMKWVTTANVHELEVRRADEYQVVGELRTRIPSWPSEAERQTFIVNRITSEFQTSWLRKPKPGEKPDPSRLAGEDVAVDVLNGTCARTFPQRL